MRIEQFPQAVDDQMDGDGHFHNEEDRHDDDLEEKGVACRLTAHRTVAATYEHEGDTRLFLAARLMLTLLNQPISVLFRFFHSFDENDIEDNKYGTRSDVDQKCAKKKVDRVERLEAWIFGIVVDDAGENELSRIFLRRHDVRIERTFDKHRTDNEQGEKIDGGDGFESHRYRTPAFGLLRMAHVNVSLNGQDDGNLMMRKEEKKRMKTIACSAA